MQSCGVAALFEYFEYFVVYKIHMQYVRLFGLRTLNFEPQGSEATELSSAICGDCASEKWEEETLGDCHHLLEAFPLIEVEAYGNDDREDIGNRCRPPDTNRSEYPGDNEH